MARTVGSGGKRKRGLAGRGPTPKAEDRFWHKARQERTKRPSYQSSRKPIKAPKGDWVVGRNPVLEAMQASLPIKAAYVAEGSERDDRLREIFKFAANHSITLLQTTRAELDRLTGGAVHQGVALQLPSYDYADEMDLIEKAADPDNPGIIVALDSITDPHNLGAIVRSAAAFGATGVIIPQRRSASVGAAAWKASAGALARLPIARCTNLNRTIQQAIDAGFWAVGLAGEAEANIEQIDDVTGPLMIVVGSEGDGLSHLTRQRCTMLASIPISSEVESLNASVATAISLYEITRSRQQH